MIRFQTALLKHLEHEKSIQKNTWVTENRPEETNKKRIKFEKQNKKAHQKVANNQKPKLKNN